MKEYVAWLSWEHISNDGDTFKGEWRATGYSEIGAVERLCEFAKSFLKYEFKERGNRVIAIETWKDGDKKGVRKLYTVISESGRVILPREYKPKNREVT